jgi:hypothetical protein
MWTTVNAKILAIGLAMHRTHDFHPSRKHMTQLAFTLVEGRATAALLDIPRMCGA